MECDKNFTLYNFMNNWIILIDISDNVRKAVLNIAKITSKQCLHKSAMIVKSSPKKILIIVCTAIELCIDNKLMMEYVHGGWAVNELNCEPCHIQSIQDQRSMVMYLVSFGNLYTFLTVIYNIVNSYKVDSIDWSIGTYCSAHYHQYLRFLLFSR